MSTWTPLFHVPLILPYYDNPLHPLPSTHQPSPFSLSPPTLPPCHPPFPLRKAPARSHQTLRLCLTMRETMMMMMMVILITDRIAHTHTYIYIYNINIHTHTHIYIYIYIYIYAYKHISAHYIFVICNIRRR